MTRILNRQLVLAKGLRLEHPTDGTLAGDHIKVVNTNGTTAVNVFGANGAPANITITSFMVIAKDTTAGNIALKQGSTTIASVAKGTTAGVVTGEDGGIASGSIAAGTATTVVSSSAGNAVVLITYTFDAV